MTKFDIPNVQRFRNRHGRWQTYYRVAGRPKVRLREEFLSPAWWSEYERAKAGTPRPEAGADRIKPGTFNAALAGYYQSVQYLGLKPSTRSVWRGILEHFRADFGDALIIHLKRRHVVYLVARKASTAPAAAGVFLKVLRSLMRFCCEV